MVSPHLISYVSLPFRLFLFFINAHIVNLCTITALPIDSTLESKPAI